MLLFNCIQYPETCVGAKIIFLAFLRPMPDMYTIIFNKKDSLCPQLLSINLSIKSCFKRIMCVNWSHSCDTSIDNELYDEGSRIINVLQFIIFLRKVF